MDSIAMSAKAKKSTSNCRDCRARRVKCVGNYDWPSGKCEACEKHNKKLDLNDPKRLKCSPRQTKQGSPEESSTLASPHNNDIDAASPSNGKLRPLLAAPSFLAQPPSLGRVPGVTPLPIHDAEAWEWNGTVSEPLDGSSYGRTEWAPMLFDPGLQGRVNGCPLGDDYIKSCFRQQQLLDLLDYLIHRRQAFASARQAGARGVDGAFEQNLERLEQRVSKKCCDLQSQIHAIEADPQAQGTSSWAIWPKCPGRKRNFHRLSQIHYEDGICRPHEFSQQVHLSASDRKAEEIWNRVVFLERTKMNAMADQECLKLARIGYVPFMNEPSRMKRIIQAFDAIAAQFTQLWTGMNLTLSQDPNPTSDNNMFSPVHLMVMFNLGWIIEKMTDLCDATRAPQDMLKRTVLHVACELKYVKLTRNFLNTFAGTEKDREARDHLKMTPLLVAICTDNLDAVEALHNDGAKLSVKDCHHRTPLMIACEKGFERIVSYLLKAGCSVHGKGNSLQSLPLYIAIVNNRFPIVALLLCHDAYPSQQQQVGRKLIATAKERGYRNIARVLENQHKLTYPGEPGVSNELTSCSSDSDSSSSRAKGQHAKQSMLAEPPHHSVSQLQQTLMSQPGSPFMSLPSFENLTNPAMPTTHLYGPDILMSGSSECESVSSLGFELSSSRHNDFFLENPPQDLTSFFSRALTQEPDGPDFTMQYQ